MGIGELGLLADLDVVRWLYRAAVTIEMVGTLGHSSRAQL